MRNNVLKYSTIFLFALVSIALVAFIISTRYTFFSQLIIIVKDVPVDIIYRYDNWTGATCIIAGPKLSEISDAILVKRHLFCSVDLSLGDIMDLAIQ